MSAATATTKAAEASNSAASAELSKNTATTKAAEASASSATAQGYKDTAVLKASEAAQSAVEAAQSAALAAGALIEAGSADLSSGVFPTPIKDAQGNNRSCFWKVIVGGSVSGDVYGIGDSLVYSKEMAGYYKIDNTEAVSSVNGKQGVVVLNKADVGLANVDNTSDLNKPVSTATQSSLDLKVDKNRTVNSKPLSDNIVLSASDVGAAPASHVGSGGTSHATATTSVDGFMSKADKSKLDAIAVSANNYVHPASGVSPGTYKAVTVDGNGHVTGGSNPTTVDGYGITDAAKTHSRVNFGESATPISTTDFITQLTNLGAFNSMYWCTKANWTYAYNNYITDTGVGTIQLAGCTVEVIGGAASAYTIRIHTSPTVSIEGAVPNAEFVYVDHGSGYSPKWHKIYNTDNKPTAVDVGAPKLVSNTIEIPSLGGGPTGCLKIEGYGDGTEAWVTTRPNNDSSHRAIGINHRDGPVYWNGAAKYKILYSGQNILGNTNTWGAGFLSAGTSGAPWVAAYFGDAAGTGSRVVTGTLNGHATIGSHSASLDSWAKLAINPGADDFQNTCIGMFPDQASGTGNLFVGNDIESNYMRLRSPIPNDARYVVNKGYVDGKFASIAYREDWADKGIHTQTAFGIGWRNYGNGHIVTDASSGNIEGISVPRTDAQTAWDNVTGATLVGWNGQSTFGVRVDRARLADAAITSDRITGVVATNGRDLTIHGKRAMVGKDNNDGNQLVINYGNDWGSTIINGNVFTGPLQSERLLAIKNGSTVYSDSQIEARSTDGSDVRIGFHRAGHSSASINHNAWGFQFERESGGVSRANVAAANFFADAAQDMSANALTRLDYVLSQINSLDTFRFRGQKTDANVSLGTGSYYWHPTVANAPIANTYAHGIQFGGGMYANGYWASDIAFIHGQGLYHRATVNGGFADWSKFAFAQEVNYTATPTQYRSTSSWVGLVSGVKDADAVVMGTNSDAATIGAHSKGLDAWTPLYVNCHPNSGPTAPVVLSTPKVKLPDNNTLYDVWHSGNFNPDSKLSENGHYGGTLKLNNWFRSIGDSGWFNETHAGGIYMLDPTWVRVYNNKKFYVDNTASDSIYSTGGGNFNDVYIRSDIRLKSDLVKIDSALDKVNSLTGYTFDKRNTLNSTETTREMGIIADDLNKVAPEAVRIVGEDNLLTISSSAVNALLIEAIKELYQEVQDLKRSMGQ